MDTQDAIYDSEIITKSISQIVYNVRSIHFNSAENHNFPAQQQHTATI